MEVLARGENPRGGGWRSISVCWRPANLRRTAMIALVVGTIFTLINEVQQFVDGKGTWVTGVKIAVNYLVPFVVANLGVLVAHRK
jgi:sterol desaturase/sphingolipid hydroxylase (fatty acid hydroxylase superfamily)